MKQTLDFIIIGAQKAGTTSLFEYLRRHPELSLPEAKELPFFNDDEARERGWEDYIGKAFASADPASKWGTATPQYMAGGLLDHPNPSLDDRRYDELTIPRRIQERLPDVRLIAVLRDPVERARSHHRMASMEGLEKRSFDQAIDDLLGPEALEDARRQPRETNGYVVWGEYGRILEAYFEVFSSSQLLVLFTDELENEPESLLQRIFEFLEVQENFVPDNLGTKYRVGGSRRRISWLGNYSSLSPLAIQRSLAQNATSRRLWRVIPRSTRRWIGRLFVRVVYRLDLWNRQTDIDVREPCHATLERLREHFVDDGDRLTRLLGSPPPWHTAFRPT